MNTFQLRGSTHPLTTLKLLQWHWLNMLDELEKTLVMSPTFFLNAPLIVDATDVEHHPEFDAEKLVQVLRERHLLPIAFRCESESLRAWAKLHHLATFQPQACIINDRAPGSEEGKSQAIQGTKLSSDNNIRKNVGLSEPEAVPGLSLIIDQPVRSGQHIYAHGGDLIILAPVSAGAEILADGNIHVYGTLRGRVYAGVNGDLSARIFCQSLAAEFISIAGRYLLCENLDFERVQNFTQIYLEENQLKIAPLVR